MTRAGSIAVLAILLSAAPVMAQDEDEDQDSDGVTGEDEAGEVEGDEEGNADEEAAEQEQKKDEDEQAGPAVPRHWFFGPYFRLVIVPSFLVPQVFVLDSAPTAVNPAFGANATFRGDSVHFVVGLGYTSYAFTGASRSKGDPIEDTEWVDSNLGLVHATGSMLWHTALSDKFAFEYGFGVDLGIVTGEMVRTEAYRPTPSSFAPCIGPLNPVPAGGWCELPQNVAAGTDAYDETGAQYHVVEERVPPVALLPMIPQLGLRWTPAPEWAVKAEFAFGIAQLWFGISAAYGPEL